MRAPMIIAGLAGLVLGGCPRAAPPHVAPTVDSELLRALAVLATKREPSHAEVEEVRGKLESGKLTMNGYLDSLLARDEFVSEVAPLIILRQLLAEFSFDAPQGRILQYTDGPKPVAYLYKPCTPDQAVPVHPWWNLDEEVRICPDSYLPDQWDAQMPAGTPPTACLSETVQSEGHGCGCGPDLIRCFNNAKFYWEVHTSLRDELRASVAYVVSHNLPIENIFTTNETFRDRNAELMLRTHVIESRHDLHPESYLREVDAWPKEGKWAPREDLAKGQNAGILTSLDLIHLLIDRRQRMTVIYDVLWCSEADSVGATPESILSVAGPDLQIKSAGWRDLAGRPICTNCHARLDYGLQFFFGFPNGYLVSYFDPAAQQTGRGPLYANNIQDHRGDAELNPLGFAQLAVAQPEFRRCMARDFTEYLLGNRTTSDETAAIESSFHPNRTTVRDLMRQAMLEMVEEWPKVKSARTLDLQPAAFDTGRGHATDRPRVAADHVAVTPGLKKQLDDECLSCHDRDEETPRPDFSVAQLDREVAVQMVDAVAFGRMPKDDPLPAAERTAFLETLIAKLWSGPDATLARAYYIDRSQALPTYRPEVIFDLAHASPAHWRLMENAVRSDVQQLTPGLAAVSSLAVIEGCREKTKTPAERERCISDALRLDNIAIQRR